MLKKTWIENLSTKVPEANKIDSCKYKYGLLECITEEAFNIKYKEFKIAYIDECDVPNYVVAGWEALNSSGVKCDQNNYMNISLSTPQILLKDYGIISNTHYCEEK